MSMIYGVLALAILVMVPATIMLDLQSKRLAKAWREYQQGER